MLPRTFFTSFLLHKCSRLWYLNKNGNVFTILVLVLFSHWFEFAFPCVLLCWAPFHVYWPVGFSLLWSVCSNILSILLLDSLSFIEYIHFIFLLYIFLHSAFSPSCLLINMCSSFSYSVVYQSFPLLLALCVSCLRHLSYSCIIKFFSYVICLS